MIDADAKLAHDIAEAMIREAWNVPEARAERERLLGPLGVAMTYEAIPEAGKHEMIHSMLPGAMLVVPFVRAREADHAALLLRLEMHVHELRSRGDHNLASELEVILNEKESD